MYVSIVAVQGSASTPYAERSLKTLRTGHFEKRLGMNVTNVVLVFVHQEKGRNPICSSGLTTRILRPVKSVVVVVVVAVFLSI